MIEFLDWTARVGGGVTLLVAVLAFVFREKWKQMLQRSLSEDLERLKSSLVKSQAEHAASLTPQLEQIKHDFQQKLEAYKVSLIAQAEEVKAKGELKKSIALRYAEIEFERLVELERLVAPITSDIYALAGIDTQIKEPAHMKQALEQLRALGRATEEAEMFMPTEDRRQLSEFRSHLVKIAQEYIGPGLPMPPENDSDTTKSMTLGIAIHQKLKDRIRQLGQI